jgi:hypothetical protein
MHKYLAYNSGNECPRAYHLWSALVVLAATTQKRVYLSHGYFKIYPNLYVCLVGRQGFRKSTAKDIARDLLTSTFPELPVAANVQSREDIIKFMASDECLFSFTDETGAVKELRPYVLLINELKNFLSINPGASIEFLTDIFDRDLFNSSTIKRGLENITNPCVNILACETPNWIIDKLKSQVISGGFSRRMLFVYETERGPKISFPTLPKNASLLWIELKEHLKKVATMVGGFTWGPGTKEHFDLWYNSLKPPDDDILEGYYESKHIQLLKVSMLLSLAEPEPCMTLTLSLMKQGIALLDALETNMPKLSVAAGRNELALPIQRILEFLEGSDGIVTTKNMKLFMNKDLRPQEHFGVLNFLTETEKIFLANLPATNGKPSGHFYVSKEKYLELRKAGAIQ